MTRTSIDHEHGGLHGPGAEPVQGFLAGLSQGAQDRPGAGLSGAAARHRPVEFDRMLQNGSSGHLMNNSRYWQRRAERVRGYAAEMADPGSRQAMLELADSYERLAQRADERAEEDELRGR